MFQKFQLSNGLEVISEPMENRKTVSLGVFIKVGSSHETKKENGICHLIEHMLFKGTKQHTAKEIADITARIGDDVNAFTSKECTALYGMTITENLQELIALLGDMLTDSLMDAGELTKEKRVILDEIDMYSDSPEDLVHELLQKRVWREDALGYLISGTKTGVKALQKKQVEDFQRLHYYAENMLISVAGAYEEQAMLTWLEEAFGSLPGHSIAPEQTAQRIKMEQAEKLALDPYHAVYEKKKEKSAPHYFRCFVTEQKEIEQLHMNLAFPALCLGDDRRFAYTVMNSAFGGSNNSRLFQKIREEEGLAYSVYSYSSAYERAGLFHIDVTVQPGLAVPVLRKMIDIIREFTANGLTEDELLMHKQQVRTELIMNAESPKTRMDSNAKFALAKAPMYTVDEKIKRIDLLTTEEIRQLAEDCLQLHMCSICIVGDKKSIDVRGLKQCWNELERKEADKK